MSSSHLQQIVVITSLTNFGSKIGIFPHPGVTRFCQFWSIFGLFWKTNFQPSNPIRTLSNFHRNEFQSSAIDCGHYQPNKFRVQNWNFSHPGVTRFCQFWSFLDFFWKTNFQPSNPIRTLSNFHRNEFQSSAIDCGHYQPNKFRVQNWNFSPPRGHKILPILVDFWTFFGKLIFSHQILSELCQTFTQMSSSHLQQIVVITSLTNFGSKIGIFPHPGVTRFCQFWPILVVFGLFYGKLIFSHQILSELCQTFTQMSSSHLQQIVVITSLTNFGSKIGIFPTPGSQDFANFGHFWTFFGKLIFSHQILSELCQTFTEMSSSHLQQIVVITSLTNFGSKIGIFPHPGVTRFCHFGQFWTFFGKLIFSHQILSELCQTFTQMSSSHLQQIVVITSLTNFGSKIGIFPHPGVTRFCQFWSILDFFWKTNFQPSNPVRTLSNFHTNEFQSSAIDCGHYQPNKFRVQNWNFSPPRVTRHFANFGHFWTFFGKLIFSHQILSELCQTFTQMSSSHLQQIVVITSLTNFGSKIGIFPHPGVTRFCQFWPILVIFGLFMEN